MNMLLTLASILGVEVDEMLEGFKKNAIAWSAVAFFALIAVAFLLVALHAALVGWIGPIWAPLAIAGFALLIVLVIVVSRMIIDSIADKRQSERRHSSEKTALVTTAALSALPLLLKSDLLRKVGLPIGGAVAALYVLGMRRRRRSRED